MKAPLPSIRGLAGLAWRSALLLPVAIALMVLYFGFWCVVWTLPVLVIAFICIGDWLYATTGLIAWIPLLLLTRWKRLHVDSRDCPNEGSNV